MQLNLTSLSKIIKDKETELKQFQNKFFEKRSNFSIQKIFYNHTEETEYNDCISSVKEKQENFHKFIDEVMEKHQKIQELRELLFETNKKYGIDIIIGKISFHKKKLSFLTSFKDKQYFYSTDENICSMTYKDIMSMFDEETKKQNVTFSVIIDSEVEKVDEYIEKEKEEIKKLENVLAQKNHTILVELKE